MGRRVTVRRVLRHDPDGRASFADVVGDLLACDAQTARIETRRGPLEIAVADLTAARLAHPSTADELGLEAVAARGWRPAQTGAVGGWLLRASDGFTGRANSVLPLRAPGLPLDDALAAAGAWYHDRGLPLRFQLPVQARRLLDTALAERGWPADPDVHVMAARLDVLPGTTTAADVAAVTVDSAPDDDWFAVYRDGDGASAAARALLTRHDAAGFAAVRDGGRVVAIGRGAVDDGWLGITAVEVLADRRRLGLATAVMRALRAWGQARGATRGYLQVSADNAAAVALYQRLGFWQHHDYRYRQEPLSR